MKTRRGIGVILVVLGLIGLMTWAVQPKESSPLEAQTEQSPPGEAQDSPPADAPDAQTPGAETPGADASETTGDYLVPISLLIVSGLVFIVGVALLFTGKKRPRTHTPRTHTKRHRVVSGSSHESSHDQDVPRPSGETGARGERDGTMRGMW